MKKKLLSIFLALSILTPSFQAIVFAEQFTEDLQAVREQMLEEDIPRVTDNEFDPEATQEPYSDEPLVHEEIIEDFQGISYIEDNQALSVIEPGSELNATSSSGTSDAELWKSMCAESFGDDYLTPYKRNPSSQSISGNTNRMVIRETDLHIPGKNGLDVNIAREYDNQGYRYSYYGTNGSQAFTTDRYCYGFKNNSTGQRLYIMFLTKDDFYEYAKDGLTISSFPSVTATKTYNGSTINCYTYENISGKSSESGIDLSYDSSMPVSNYAYNGYTSQKLHYNRLATEDNSLKYGWRLMIPEIYLWEYDNDSDTDGYPKTYTNYYLGTFRDFDGETYSLKGVDTVTKSSNNTYTYTSSFSSDNNGYLKYEGFFADQTISGTDITYNFAVYDSRGKTYYFKNTGIDGTGNIVSNARISLKAVSDRYNNLIKYEYSHEDMSKLSKITDTYGREIFISDIYEGGAAVGKKISYNDTLSGQIREIVYRWETMSPSTLNNDSNIKGKNVLRFKATNAEGEETIYDARETETFAYFKSSASGNMLSRPNIILESDFDASKSYNIERIIYPTGSESRYKYKKIYRFNTNTKAAQELYAVEKAYDIIDNVVSNSREYTLSNYLMAITKQENNLSSGLVTKSSYNNKSLLSKTVESLTGSETGIYRSVTNTYNDSAELTKQIVNNSGISNTTEYTYSSGHYFNSPSSIKTDRTIVTYTYQVVNNKITDTPNNITYKQRSGYSSVIDYSISNTFNGNGSIELTKKIKDSKILTQEKYLYDSSGRIISTLQWDSDSNSDGSLDENDDCIVKSMTYNDSDIYSPEVNVRVDSIYDYDGDEEDSLNELYKYNINGYPVQKEDSYNTATKINYDALSRPIKYEYANGAERTIEYNTAQKYTIITDEAGTQFKNTYDGFGRLTGKYYYDGSWKTIEKYTYDTAGRLSSSIKYASASNYTKETYEYDVLDRLSQKKVYKGLSNLLYTEDYTYAVQNDQSVITKATTAQDGSSAAAEKQYYDQYGRSVKQELSDGTITISNTYTYDYKDNMLTETDGNGNTTTYEYDSNDLLSKKTLPDGHSYMWVHDMLGRVKQSFDSAPFAFTWYKYDSLNREIWRKEPFGTNYKVTKQYYDANSNVIKTLEQNNADNNTSEDSYKQTLYIYNGMNNLVGVIGNTGTRNEAVQYWYDSANRLIAMQTGRSSINSYQSVPTSGAVTKYEYDKLGHLSKETDALGNYSEFSNDYAGNVITKDDRNQNYIANGYDIYGITYSYLYGNEGFDKENYTYDDLGRITQKKTTGTSGNDTINYTYDAFGRVTSESGDGYTNEYTYDLNSNITSYTLKEGSTIKSSEAYEYDGANHLTKQTVNGKIITYKYSHGLMTQKNVDGIVTNISYNKAKLPKSYTTQKNNSMLSSYSYTYSLDGNRIGEVDNVNNITRSYTYDGVGRLTNEAISGSMDLNMAYTYDIRGNRTKKTVTGDESYTITSSYNYSNRLTSSTKRVNGVISETNQYGYDSNGNQISKTHTDYGTASLSDVGEAIRNDYEYFAAAPAEEEAPEIIMDEAEETELEAEEPEGIFFGEDEATESIGDIIPEAETESEEPDITEYIADDTAELMDTTTTTETFTYNARNQLTAYENTATGTSAGYTYGANGLRKSKTVGSTTTDFVWNGSNLAAEKKSGSIKNIYSYGTDGIAVSNINGTLSYYLKDAHGNVVGTTNTSGMQNKSYNFDAFGNQFNAVLSSDTNPFRYCGEYYDNESGNIYLRARYYDTASGRFISEDPIKDGLNWYSYCAGNPVRFVDPSGYLRAGYTDENGEYHADPDAEEFGKESDTYKALVDLGRGWEVSDDNDRIIIEQRAEQIRTLARQGTPISYKQDEIMELLHSNADKANEYMWQYYFSLTVFGNAMLDPYTWFVGETCSTWDYKRQSHWQVPYEEFMGMNMNENNAKNWVAWMYFDGMLISGDKLGNINLGYVGAKMGFSGVLLENDFTTDKDDGPYVRYGINMANNGR